LVFVFFFQAEDGIRDDLVTGVQTCALPILRRARVDAPQGVDATARGRGRTADFAFSIASCGILSGRGVGLIEPITASDEELAARSEERRVGKECRERW